MLLTDCSPVVAKHKPHLAVLQVFEFFESARPVRSQEAGERAVRKNLSVCLTPGAIVRFVLGIANSQNLFAASGAWLAVAPVDGHACAKGGHFFGEAGPRFGLQAVDPECEYRSHGCEQSFPFDRSKLVRECDWR